jgi:hypothetical protein
MLRANSFPLNLSDKTAEEGESMKKMIVCLSVFIFWSSDLAAQAPYYQGKTIRAVVGYPAGSAHDQWARLIAPQLTKHIPGNAATVVQTMTGAGSMTATLSRPLSDEAPYRDKIGAAQFEHSKFKEYTARQGTLH